MLAALQALLPLRNRRPCQLGAMLDRGLIKLAKAVTQIQDIHPWSLPPLSRARRVCMLIAASGSEVTCPCYKGSCRCVLFPTPFVLFPHAGVPASSVAIRCPRSGGIEARRLKSMFQYRNCAATSYSDDHQCGCDRHSLSVRMLNTHTRIGRSTFHGGCLQSALELFCGLLLSSPSAAGEANSDLIKQGILFINSVMRNPGYRGTTSVGVTLTAASREQVQAQPESD